MIRSLQIINMRHCLLWILCMLCFADAKAQRQGNVWVFGNHAGLDFNSGNPVGITTSIQTIEGSASVCNAAGQLLFYTEGSTIWDRNGAPMPAGSNLTGLILPGYSPTASTTQSSVIVPIPDSSGRYLVFSLTDGTIAGKHNLYYSVVDMSLNGGLGDVVPGRKGILLDSALSEKLTAAVGKCCNIWVVVNRGDGNFHAYEVTSSGLNTHPVISPSGINNGFSYNFGEIKFSPDGKRMAAGSQSFFGLKLYDFNGYTGVFSNIQTLQYKDFYGVCFSPDNTKLYAAADSLYQYDITLSTQAAITASEKKLARTGGLTNVKLAPNGKIYFAGISGLSAVNYPNLSGTSAQVVSNAVSLAAGTNLSYGGLSNEVPVLVRDTAVPVRHDTAVCFRDSVTIFVPAPGCDYQWDNGTSDSARIITASGNYVLYYHTPPCVFHADTFAVHFAAAVPTTGSYSGCRQGSGYLYILPVAGNTYTYTYTWRNSSGNVLQSHTGMTGDTLHNINPGAYTVEMSGNGCDTIIQLTLPPPGSIQLKFDTDTTICTGDTSFFNNTSVGYNDFLWLFGDGDTSRQVSPQHLYRHPGVYHVMLVGFPCNDTISKTIIADSMSYISFGTLGRQFCEGDSIAFQLSYPPRLSYITWSFGDGSTWQGIVPKHAYDAPGSYVITADALFLACHDRAYSDTVHIYPYPVVDLGPDTAICEHGAPIALYNLAAAPPFYHYRWNTGDTTEAIQVTAPGSYALAVTSDHGCTTSDNTEVRRSCYIDIPNVFTPNGDGLNDYFFPRNLLSRALTDFHMQIFSRWGEKIFETTSTTGRGWDGRYGGKPMPQGVYVYLIEATIEHGPPEKYQGNVTLIR